MPEKTKEIYTMKKIVSLIIAVLLLMSSFAMADTLIMATNAAFPPYEFHDTVDGEDVIMGIDAEIFRAICAYLGYDAEIEDIDFAAIIPDLNAGKADVGMAGMTVTDDRKLSVLFSETYATGIQVVIVKEDSAITSVDDIFAEGSNWLVGTQEATTGFLYATWDIEDEGLGSVSAFKTGADAVEALKTGKVDFVIIDNEPAKAFVAANEGLKILDTEYVTEEYAAAFALNNTELQAAFNEALAALTEDGTIPAIIEKYIPSEEAAE